MKIWTIIFLAIITTLATSCDKVPVNGDLDGMWQVMSITHNGQVEEVKEQQSYLSIQLHLFQLGTLANSIQYFGYFDHTKDSLYLRNISVPSQHEQAGEDDVLIDERDIAKLHRWGIYRSPDGFKVITLNNDKLVLQSDSVTVSFRKF